MRAMLARTLRSEHHRKTRAIDIEDNYHFLTRGRISKGGHPMSGLFGSKSREEREGEKQQEQTQLKYQQAEAMNQYDGMVTKALDVIDKTLSDTCGLPYNKFTLSLV